MSFGLLKKSIPEKVQRRENKRPQQKVADVLTETFLTRRQREWHAEMKAMHQRLDQRQKESQQRRLQESPLRRVHPLHERDEEELDHYSRGNHASVQRRSRLRRDQEARSLRHVREEQTISKPKAFSKSYTANPVAKGKAVDSNSKSECRTRTTGRVHIPSPHVESGERVKSKAEAVHYRTREVRCFKCQGLGHFANECTNKKTMVLFEHGEFETKQEVENASASEEEELVKILVKDDISVSSFKTEKAVAKEQENKENDQDQLMLETKNEEAMKQSLGSIDESADALTERHSLMSTPDSYTLRYTVVEKVDFVFGDSAFSKPENKVKSLLAETMKPSREKKLSHFWLSKTEPIQNIEGEKHRDFELFFGREVSKAITLDKSVFLKEIGIVTIPQRSSPIMDKVRDGRKVIEPSIQDRVELQHIVELEDMLRETILSEQRFKKRGTTRWIFGSSSSGLKPSYSKEKKPVSTQFFSIKDGTVSRTKLFQEEGYDVIMESSKKTRVPCSAQTKSMINLYIPSGTLSTFSPHLEHTSKLKQFNPSSGEEVIQLPSQVIPSLRDSNIHAFNNYFQPNQKESSYETNYSGILNHQRIWENWIPNNAGSDLADMNFTSQWFCFEPFCATEPKIMMHSPTQVRYRRKTNWRILLDLLGFQQAQEQKKWTSDHKVIAHLPKRVNLVLYLKNSKPSPIKSLQNYVWHPGTSIKPKGQCMAQNKVSNSWS